MLRDYEMDDSGDGRGDMRDHKDLKASTILD